MTTTEEKNLLYKVLGFVASAIITISMAVSGYFINQNMQSIRDMREDIVQLKIDSEKTSANSFTSGDFVQAKALIDQQIINSDRKILILEEGQKQIKELLNEIKDDVKSLHNNPQ